MGSMHLWTLGILWNGDKMGTPKPHTLSLVYLNSVTQILITEHKDDLLESARKKDIPAERVLKGHSAIFKSDYPDRACGKCAAINGAISELDEIKAAKKLKEKIA